jgi:heme-degrading monooxygenase HmoA
MSNAVFFNSYKLKEGVSVPDFLIAIEQLLQESVSKQKGFISSKLMAEGEAWADYVIFETMDDLNAFLKSAEEAQANGANDLAEKFYSFLDFNTLKSHIYSVEKCFPSNK